MREAHGPVLHPPNSTTASRGDFDPSGDDRNLAVDRLDEAFDHRSLLVGRQEGALAGMTENDQAFHAVEAAEPGAQPLDRRMVDLAVAGEGGDGGGNETSEIKGFSTIAKREILI